VGGLVIGVHHKVFAFLGCYAALFGSYLPEQHKRVKTSTTPRWKREIVHMCKSRAVLKYSDCYLGSIHEFSTDEQGQNKGAKSVIFLGYFLTG
jgi:hypothetical protein